MPRREGDDAEDVLAARQGDRAAFARLHQRYAQLVHGIALSRARHADAADLVQESFLLALDRLHLLRDNAAFGPWIAAITRNLAIESHRRNRLRLHDRLDESTVQPSAEGASPQNELAHALLAAIQSLPEAYAETLVLRLLEGLTGPQIAACTGLTHGSVRVNLTRGMHMLRERLKEQNIHPETSP